MINKYIFSILSIVISVSTLVGIAVFVAWQPIVAPEQKNITITGSLKVDPPQSIYPNFNLDRFVKEAVRQTPLLQAAANDQAAEIAKYVSEDNKLFNVSVEKHGDYLSFAIQRFSGKDITKTMYSVNIKTLTDQERYIALDTGTPGYTKKVNPFVIDYITTDNDTSSKTIYYDLSNTVFIDDRFCFRQERYSQDIKTTGCDGLYESVSDGYKSYNRELYQRFNDAISKNNISVTVTTAPQDDVVIFGSNTRDVTLTGQTWINQPATHDNTNLFQISAPYGRGSEVYAAILRALDKK